MVVAQGVGISSREHVDIWALADLATPWCIRVATTLRIAEHIASGITDIGELASRSGTNAGALQRLLRHLANVGIFVEPAPGRFELNDAARELMAPSTHLGCDLSGIGGRMTGAWPSLLNAVKTGSAAYDGIFGRPFWEDLDANPDVAATFDELIGPPGHGTPGADVLASDDWESIRTVVDVGGGTGALLAEVLRVHPHVRGVLVDLPRTVARSAAIFEAAGVADRVTLSSQSFFDPLPAGADLYLLKNVLSDWPDREALALLRRCAEAARPAGRVAVLSGVAPEGSRPSPELLMLVLVGGTTRSLTEFRDLAREAGLEVHTAARNRSGRFIVECRAGG